MFCLAIKQQKYKPLRILLEGSRENVNGNTSTAAYDFDNGIRRGKMRFVINCSPKRLRSVKSELYRKNMNTFVVCTVMLIH